MRTRGVMSTALTVVGVAVGVMVAACSPGDGPESIPLPTSPDTTTTTSTTTTSTTTTTTTTTIVPPAFEVTIRRTTDGVPHITGRDRSDVAFGQGYVSAEDHGCTLLDQIFKVSGTRSVNLGPGTNGENIESDFAWLGIGIADLAAADYETAPAALRDQFDAFAAGWNQYLDDQGTDGLTGWCADAEWVRPIEGVEVYTHSRGIALLASSARMAPYIPGAQPPVTPDAGAARPTPDFAPIAPATTIAPAAQAGSNAWGIGDIRTETGQGAILVGNPHFPWEGELRFAEVHLVVPGEIDIYGAQLVGLPGVGIGFTDEVGWSHTVSAGKRMTLYRLTLVPDAPTTYLVDGEPREMTATDHTVEILRPDGSVDSETRTLWRSEYGPIIDFPGLGWTGDSVLTFRDANIDNDEQAELYGDLLDVTDLDDLIDTHRRHQGVSAFNTVAAGADGRVWYADTAATPNLSDAAENAFIGALLNGDPVTTLAYDAGVILLDGSDSTFRWQEVEGARDPGLVPFDELPRVQRRDHVFNANDSFWIPNAATRLTGPYSVANGEQGTPVSMRTKQNALVLAADDPLDLAGDDDRFSFDEALTATFDNTAHTAVVLREQVVAACRATPVVEIAEVLAADGSVALPAGPVDLTAACDVLDTWDGRYDLDSVGPLLWRGTMTRFTPAERENRGRLFGDAFDPAAPLTTPALLNADTGPVLEALALTAATLAKAGFEVDSPLGSAQFTERSGERISLHGGQNVDGTTNIVDWSSLTSSREPQPERGEVVVPGGSLRGEGYPVNFGTSFVFVADWSSGELQAAALLTYGQTGDRESPLFSSQTVRYSEKEWREVALTDDEIAADPDLVEMTITRP